MQALHSKEDQWLQNRKNKLLPAFTLRELILLTIVVHI